MKKASAILVVFLAGVLLAAQNPPEPPEPPSTPQATPAPAPRARVRRPVHARLADDEMSSRRAYLGVGLDSISPSRASELKLKDARGVEVVMLDGDSPACKAGMKEHDVIQSFDGKPVNSSSDLDRYIRETGPDKTVAIGLVRDGKPMTLNVTLATHEQMVFGNDMHIVIPRMNVTIPHIPEIPAFVMMQSWRRSGVQVENLNSQLGEFFGVKNGEGVLVRAVDKGSRAEQAGLKAGDVIVRVGNQRISGTDDFMRALRETRGGNVQLGIVRDRREQSLSMVLPASSPGDGSDMRDIEINIPADEIRASMQDWSEKFRKEMEQNSREWQKAWKEQEKQLREQMRQWERDDQPH